MTIDKFMNTAAGIVLVALPIAYLFNLHFAPRTSPSHVFPAIQPVVSGGEANIDGEDVQLDWHFELEGAKPYYRGANSRLLFAENGDVKIYMDLCRDDRIDITNLRVFKAGQKYIYESPIPLEGFRCEQGDKRMLVKGLIDIGPITMTNDDEAVADTIQLSVKKLFISLDSELIYEWSDKGGKTYRL